MRVSETTRRRLWRSLLHGVAGAAIFGALAAAWNFENSPATDDDAIRLGATAAWPADFAAAPGALALAAAIAFLYAVALRQAHRLRDAHSRLEDSERRFRDFADAGSDWSWETDAEHRFTWVGGGYFEAYGIDVSPFIGLRPWEVAPDGAGADPWSHGRAIMERREPFRDSRVRQIAPDGKPRYMTVSGKPIYDSKGRFRGYRGVGRDVTPEVEAAARIAEMNQRVRDLLDGLPLGVTLFNADARLIVANKEMETIFQGAENVFVVGASYDEIYCFAKSQVSRRFDGPNALEEHHDFEAARQEGDMRYELLLDDGRWMQTTTRRGGDGSLIVAMTDVSELKRREAELRDAINAADAASRAKSEFLANMSHELRTPLNAIIGFSETLLEGHLGAVDNPRHRDYLADILRSGRLLLGIIDDILDLAKIEAGRHELVEERVDAAAATRKAARLLRDDAARAGLEVELDVPEGPLYMRADARALTQITLNLLSNAVKFTPKGRVALRLRREATGGAALVVEDSGVGMTPEEARRALEPFAQLSSVMSRGHGGVGLGLPVVRALVDLHGGELRIDSAPGQGTRVVAAFPAERVVAPEPGVRATALA